MSKAATLQLGSLHVDARALVELGRALGWSVRQNGRMIYLTSPLNNGITVNLPTNGQLNDLRRKSAVQRLLRYSDQSKVALLMVRLDEENRPPTKLNADILFAVRRQLGVDETKPTPVFKAPEKVTERPKTIPAIPALTVTTERPWMAKGGSSTTTGYGYESHTTIERHWSNGTVDYRCAWPGCNYSEGLPISVARHYGRTKSHQPVPKAEVIKTEPYEFTPRQQLAIARFTREISQALRAIPTMVRLTGAELAQALAEQIVKARAERGETHHDEGEPLTAEQVVERIRRMVDDGSYARRIEEQTRLETELAEAKELLARSEANCAEVVRVATEGNAELEKLKIKAAATGANLNALKSMIADLTIEEIQ